MLSIVVAGVKCRAIAVFCVRFNFFMPVKAKVFFVIGIFILNCNNSKFLRLAAPWPFTSGFVPIQMKKAIPSILRWPIEIKPKFSHLKVIDICLLIS